MRANEDFFQIIQKELDETKPVEKALYDNHVSTKNYKVFGKWVLSEDNAIILISKKRCYVHPSNQKWTEEEYLDWADNISGKFDLYDGDDFLAAFEEVMEKRMNVPLDRKTYDQAQMLLRRKQHINDVYRLINSADFDGKYDKENFKLNIFDATLDTLEFEVGTKEEIRTLMKHLFYAQEENAILRDIIKNAPGLEKIAEQLSNPIEWRINVRSIIEGKKEEIKNTDETETEAESTSNKKYPRKVVSSLLKLFIETDGVKICELTKSHLGEVLAGITGFSAGTLSKDIAADAILTEEHKEKVIEINKLLGKAKYKQKLDCPGTSVLERIEV